jgi:hypothetical protein
MEESVKGGEKIGMDSLDGLKNNGISKQEQTNAFTLVATKIQK